MTDTTTPEAPTYTSRDKLVLALAKRPQGATSVELAELAGIGRSTASKLLVKLAKEGIAAKTPVEGPSPNIWVPVIDTPADEAPAPVEVDTPADQEAAEWLAARHDEATPAPAGTEEYVHPDAEGITPDDMAADQADPADQEADPAPADEAPAGDTPAHPNSGQKRPIGEVGKGGLVILASGGLRAEVLDYLAEHPGEHTPARVAKALGGRSGGAVQKIMAKLVAEQVAELTLAKPKTYRLVG